MKKVLVLGSMNNLPTCYAADLAALSCEVIQVVGFSKKYHLHDPSNFLSSEQLKKFVVLRIPFFHNFILPWIASVYSFWLSYRLPKGWIPDIVIFNDTYLTLAQYFPASKKIFVPHGGDIETWCGFNGATPEMLAKSMRSAGIFKLMPYRFRYHYISMMMRSFKCGLNLMDGVIYFPVEFTDVTKSIQSYCCQNSIFYWERYDISLEPLSNNSDDFVTPDRKKFRILIPVRFAYMTFPELNDEFNKGSDLILEGLNQFLSTIENPWDFEVVCYEKGGDLANAKALIDTMPLLKQVVTWRSAVPFDQFMLDLKAADFCFDSVGKHWPSAVAAYCLVLGINIGANFKKVRHLLPSNAPHLYNISTVSGVRQALDRAYERKFNQDIDQEVLSDFRDAYSTMNVATKIYRIL